MAADIVVLRDERIAPAELRRPVDLFFEDMVKCVVDVGRGVVAVGGEMQKQHRALLRALLLLTPAGARQLPFLMAHGS